MTSRRLFLSCFSHGRVWAILALTMAVVGSGCSNKPTRQLVSGTVTFEGQSAALGSIFFDPDATKGNHGPAAYATIKDGHYTMDQNLGAMPGSYTAHVAIAYGPGKPADTFDVQVEMTSAESPVNIVYPPPK